MAYDEGLIERIRQLSMAFPDALEKGMFGGRGFFVNGHYAYGGRTELVVRVGPDAYAEALAHPHAREMDITGRPMRGWVFVNHDGIAEDDDLLAWMRKGIEFTRTLPPK